MPDRPTSPDSAHTTARRENLLTGAVVLLAFALYAAGAARGLTWAHQGADGGELVTAAVVNGVPHPPGYPLYILLLQAWLWLARSFGLGGDLNWQAALFSALCAALSVGVTLRTALHLGGRLPGRPPSSRKTPLPLLYALPAAAAWAISPLLWSQAVIAEVYALHALLLALLGWAVLVHPTKLWYVTLIVACGVANHLTTLLLLPAAAYALWAAGRQTVLQAAHSEETAQAQPPLGLWRIAGALGAGLLLGAALYLRIPLAAQGTPPVNWGYADNWAGFWWLLSGAAYRGYLFNGWPGVLLPQLAGWAATITAQYTPVGLAVALVGLAHWDRAAGWLRNFSLLWLLPVSAYAVAYYTRDSDIYLLPVGWLMALWLAAGLAQVGGWLARWLARWLRERRLGDRWLWGTAALLLGSLIGVSVWRWPQMALTADREARDYLAQSAAVLEPDSIVVTLDDRQTFAFWYGVWGNRELAERVGGIVPINDSLYQFDWYRRLQADLYPQIGGIGESVDAVITANWGKRPIYFAQLPANIAESELTPAGPLWRLNE